MNIIDNKGVIGAATAGAAGALAGAPWGIVVAFSLTIVIADYAWRVFERPDLAQRWLDVWDRRRSRVRRIFPPNS